MQIIKSKAKLQKTIKSYKLKKKSIGFVPTMGALHEGHLSLLRKAQKNCDLVVLSIFVNPTQFGPNEDFDKYPREEKKDILLARKEKVDIIFYPSVEEIYPTEFDTTVHVDKIGRLLCGKKRKGHFDGVATIVLKLLNLVEPDQMFLGQKDFQQTVVLKRMVADLNIPSRIIVCPTVREADGLALSSRNKYLTATQRSQAPILISSLKFAKKKILDGEKSPSKVLTYIKENIRKHSKGSIEYVEIVNANTLETAKKLSGKILIALAVKFGQTRLIDNIVIKIK